jgi:hypothetical protein
MRIPFTIDEFLDVFRRYNEAVWPAQWILVLLAAATVVAALRTRRPTRTPLLLLSGFWLWMGIVYHFGFFRSINPAAALFTALFVMQAGLLLWVAFREPARRFTLQRDGAGRFGGSMIVFSLIIYPLLGWLLGHRYPYAPTFGLPCPTTVFTFGLLLLARPALPRRAFIIPVLWSAVATSAALQLGMMEDLSLPVAAIIAMVLALQVHRPVPWLRRA